MRTDRREFLKATGLITASMLVPRFLRATDTMETISGRSLVVIQLTGGNDGLNTVIPYSNDIYYRSRPRLAIESSEVLKLNDEQGFHPSFVKMKGLFDNGDLCVLNSVGYPEPSRSHFRSLDIWQSASDASQYLTTGWIGRMMEANNAAQPHFAIELDDALSLALKGKEVKGLAMRDPRSLYANASHPYIQKLASCTPSDHDHAEVSYLHRTLAEAKQSAAYVYETSKKYASSVAYPSHRLGQDLKTIAELIVSGVGSKVYYVSHSGYDTHVGQQAKQSNLLNQYDEAVSSFVADLRNNARFKDVVILTFSEFGRRVAQNASGGTDHGTSNNVFVIGGSLRQPGVLNEAPDLSDLDQGDLKFELDFRQVYSTILEKWLHQSPAGILGQQFDPLPFL
jgi:uncharacterized protein (DUF1501 family)